MRVSSQFGLRDVSEKSIEVDVLNELASFLWSRFGLTMTAISPTQKEEDSLGFDDILEGLPPGQVIAIQFKRPYQMRRPANAVRFSLSTCQLERLADNFWPNKAFLFLTPLPTNEQLLRNRLNLLRMTVALDVHSIPNVRKRIQETRTIRVYFTRHGHRISRVKISDPREFEEMEGVLTVAQLAQMICEGEVGHRIGEDWEPSDRREPLQVRRLSYVHAARRDPSSDASRLVQ